MRSSVLAAAGLLALAGCDTSAPDGPNAAATSGADAIQNRLMEMPEGQRNAVFIRAIRDADQECQHVEASEPAGEHQGFPVWNATCAGGGTWTIVVMNDGNAAVLNAEETRLVGDNEAAAMRNEGR